MKKESLKSKIELMLKQVKVEHEFIPLPASLPIDVESHVKFHGIEMKQAVATMIYKTEKGLIAAQRQADAKIDSKKLKKLVGVQRLSLATADDLGKLGVEPGVVPLVGLDIPMFTDKKVLHVNQVYGGGGDRLFALKLNSEDLVKVNKATVDDFTVVDLQAGRIRIFSGIRATGRLHLGNYLGAVKGMLALQDDSQYEMFFAVVDVHAMTTPYDKATLGQKTREVVLDYLSAGMDPKKSGILIQSKVADLHSELMFYFSTVVNVARMQHLPTFKEKVKQYPQNVTMALLNYPILMAADILAYKSELVPVGIDQEPHLEVTREIARKMNEQYGTDFPEPKRFATKGEYVPSLTGGGKMSKSVEGSFITLTDDLATIKEKLAKVPTDSGKGENVPSSGGIANLFAFVELFMGQEKRKGYEKMYVGEGIRYQELKAELAEAIYRELEPMQKKRGELEAKPEYVDELIRDGAVRARKIAEETVREVREKMGLK